MSNVLVGMWAISSFGPMSISGHRDPKVFRRYNITATADQRAALRGVDAYRAARVEHGQKADSGAR